MNESIIAIVCTLLASSGFWSYLLRKQKTESAETKLMIGLGHVKIIDLCMEYIERGYITKDEYDSLNKYLYIPYKELGGNGTAERMMEEVAKLPIKEH